MSILGRGDASHCCGSNAGSSRSTTTECVEFTVSESEYGSVTWLVSTRWPGRCVDGHLPAVPGPEPVGRTGDGPAAVRFPGDVQRLTLVMQVVAGAPQPQPDADRGRCPQPQGRSAACPGQAEPGVGGVGVEVVQHPGQLQRACVDQPPGRVVQAEHHLAAQRVRGSRHRIRPHPERQVPGELRTLRTHVLRQAVGVEQQVAGVPTDRLTCGRVDAPVRGPVQPPVEFVRVDPDRYGVNGQAMRSRVTQWPGRSVRSGKPRNPRMIHLVVQLRPPLHFALIRCPRPTCLAAPRPSAEGRMPLVDALGSTPRGWCRRARARLR